MSGTLDSKRLSGTQWMVLAAAFLGWMFDGLEMGLFPIAARPALQDLLREQLAPLHQAVSESEEAIAKAQQDVEKAQSAQQRAEAQKILQEAEKARQEAKGRAEAQISRWISVFVAMFLFGAALGGLLFGWLGDRMGRVRTMAMTIFAYSIFTGACYFATAPWQLAVLRFLAALGMGGEWSLGVALVVEYWPEKLRPLMAGIIGAASNVGFALVAVIAMMFHVTADSWRWIMLACATPAALAVLILLLIPESQRWAESVKRTSARPIREIFTTRLVWPTLLAICFASVALIGTWGAVSQFLPTWTDQMAGPDRPGAKGTVQLLISIGAIAGCIAAPLAGGKIGRRPAYFGLCVCSLLACGYLFGTLRLLPQSVQDSAPAWLATAFGGLSSYGPQFLAATVVVGFFTAAFYGWLPLYLPELFPTRVRATGQGLSFNFGRIFAAFGALGTGQLMGFFGGSYPRACATITLVYLVGMVLIWLAPETKGKPLPD